MIRAEFSSKPRRAPHVFFTRLCGVDYVVLGGMGPRFSRGIIRGAAKRCGRGFPQVLLCEPLRDMKPFPTSFWLVCPYLTRLLGRMESAGGVREMEEASAGHKEQWREYHKSHALLRLSMIGGAKRAFLRGHERALYRALSNRGVGGMAGQGRDGVSSGPASFVKCLHLQAASYLGLGRHPMSEWLSARIGSWECSDGECGRAKQREMISGGGNFEGHDFPVHRGCRCDFSLIPGSHRGGRRGGASGQKRL